MPLVKIFSKQPLKVPVSKLHTTLVKIWGVSTTPEVLKVLNLPLFDASGYEDVFVDIRAKQKVERTAEVLQDCCQQTADLFSQTGHSCRVRLEVYEPSLQFTAPRKRPPSTREKLTTNPFQEE
ncbi:unnamed protein product [Symbiodinium sp. KB8]|nr:unnamed protein product [Symbiodinium sp. KB8]|mmetsp:Transcript_101122/g.241028  ORF Transcript_101122/g.241028 Transcript_101122/m.241028 type:complete len:123 (-) Transcript_101122:44-412(-)